MKEATGAASALRGSADAHPVVRRHHNSTERRGISSGSSPLSLLEYAGSDTGLDENPRGIRPLAAQADRRNIFRDVRFGRDARPVDTPCTAGATPSVSCRQFSPAQQFKLTSGTGNATMCVPLPTAGVLVAGRLPRQWWEQECFSDAMAAGLAGVAWQTADTRTSA